LYLVSSVTVKPVSKSPNSATNWRRSILRYSFLCEAAFEALLGAVAVQ
jgi:hypothetical protein